MSGPIDMALLPRTASLDADGRMSVGGCDLAELADGFGTPLVVYDEEDLRHRCREYAEHFGAGSVFYASKAFLCRAMARLVESEGLGLDVATGGELHVAAAAGFPPERIVFHGNNKSVEELRLALEVGVGRIVVDSFDEIDRLEALAAEGLSAPSVLVRVTPGVEPDTHGHIRTGHEDSKFGFGVPGGAAFEAARRAAAGPHMDLAGVHAHIGSQVMALDVYAQAADVIADLVVEVEAATGAAVREVNLGGGLGVAYEGGHVAPSVGEYAETLLAAFHEACVAGGLGSVPAVYVEPGRSIAARAGLTLYRVGTIKAVEGSGRTYIAVDGGMSDNARPSMYGARYEAFLPSRAGAERDRVASVAGKHCEQGDVLIHDASVPADVTVGDVLCTPVTGAYAYSMASNYNLQTRPAVVFVAGGEARVVMRRESFDDLLRLDEG